MTDGQEQQSGEAGQNRLTSLLVVAMLLIVPAWQVAMVFRREFNWDEYYFLTRVFQYRQGTLTQSLQTFHVHLFSWLADLPWSDSNRIVTGRGVMLVLHLATLWFLYGLTRQLLTRAAAIWTVALYASLQFVLVHATSFRADTLITFLLVGALYLLALRPLHFLALLAAFLATGLALLVSIKSLIYLPIGASLLALQLIGSTTRRQDARRIAIALALAGLAVAGAYFAHALSLGSRPDRGAQDLASIARTQFGSQGMFTGLRFLIHSLFVNAAFYMLALAGVFAAFRTLLRSSSVRGEAALLLALAWPLVLPIVYRNSFPYAYVFLMAPVSVVAGLAASRMTRYGRAIALLLAVAVLTSLPAFKRSQLGQRQVEAVVHRMFPAPVPYIDRCGMIASFPMANFFMSTWGFGNYLRAGQPVLAEAIEQLHPPLLLATHPVIEQALGLEPSGPTGGIELLSQDERALRENYIQHWGPIWIAGKRLAASEQGQAFELLIPGRYTFESKDGGRIDGEFIAGGTVITLAEGAHSFSGPDAVLRFGDHLSIPDELPPPPFFLGF